MPDRTTSANSASTEFLSFRVGGECYAIDIASTREIRGWAPPSSMPDAQKSVLGVINLRGEVLPLVDLAGCLGLPTPEVNQRSVIIVAEIQGGPIGLLVDGVSDIIAPTSEELQPPPDVTRGRDHSFVQALAFIGSDVVRILDLSAVMPAVPETA